MNNTLYWKIRKLAQNLIFKIKAVLYRALDVLSENREYKSFNKTAIRCVIQGILKSMILLAVVITCDKWLLLHIDLPLINKDFLMSTVVGGISIAGVILGLYCANMASVYSSTYSNAPENISEAFQNDRLSRKCISGIIDYIEFGFFILIVIMMGIRTGLGLLAVFTVWSIYLIISYSLAGNRAYQLSNLYNIAADSHRVLYRVITKRLNHKLFATDPNFQKHFLKVAEKQVLLLQAIQKFAASKSDGHIADNTVMFEYMHNDLSIIELYWMNKKSISRNSLWFRTKYRYPKWHCSDDSKTSISLRTGTELPVENEHDYWWFEEELFSINRNCLRDLFKQHDFTSIYIYLNRLMEMGCTAIENKELDFYVSHIDWVREEILKNKGAVSDLDDEARHTFAGVVDVVVRLYLNIILKSSNIYINYDLNNSISTVIRAIDSGKKAEDIEFIRGKQEFEFYRKIVTEVQIEGTRLTPEWVIKQQLAKEEYMYLNSILDTVRDGINSVFNFGKELLENKLYSEACIVLISFYEYESKLLRFMDVVKQCEKQFTEYHIDKALKWEEFRIKELKETETNWKKEIPSLLTNASSQFVLKHWESIEEYPDFLGGCYNHICEDAVDAIASDNINQFKVDFANLTKLILLYQEYIRADFIRNKDSYKVEYAYYIFTSPIAEWAQIGGLAILWGEFHQDDMWKNHILTCCKSLFTKADGTSTDLPEKLIHYMQGREQFKNRFGGRSILETDWQLKVVRTINESRIVKSENTMFENRLKTTSKLLKVFCPRFTERLDFDKDAAEVFWVVCVNPFVSDDKKYHTRSLWEDKFNDSLV